MSSISHDGGSPWGWCHMNTSPYCSITGQTRSRLDRFGVSWSGIAALRAVRPPLPTVERALDAVADDPAPVADVGTEVLAVGFEDVQLAVLVAVGSQVLAEVAQRTDHRGGELRGPPDLVPASGLPREGDLHGDSSSYPVHQYI